MHRRLVHCRRSGSARGDPRHRKATRTQCTIRAPARDHESHSGSGSRKRSGVPSGSGILRAMVRSPHNFQVPFAASRMPCGSRAEPKTPFGNPKGMQAYASDPGSNAARGIPCGPTYICNECNLVGTEEQELWGRPGTPGRIAVSIMPVPEASQKTTTCDALAYKLVTLLDLCVSSLCRGHANLHWGIRGPRFPDPVCVGLVTARGSATSTESCSGRDRAGDAVTHVAGGTGLVQQTHAHVVGRSTSGPVWSGTLPTLHTLSRRGRTGCGVRGQGVPMGLYVLANGKLQG